MRHHLVYWKPQRLEGRAIGEPVQYVASDNFASGSDGELRWYVQPGDVVWPISIVDSRLLIVSRVVVSQCLPFRGVQDVLEVNFAAKYYVLSSTSQPAVFSPLDVTALASELRFESKGSPRLNPGFSGQNFQSRRILTPSTVALFESEWDSRAVPSRSVPTDTNKMRRSANQGTALDSIERLAVELHAMAMATTYYESQGYAVDDRSSNSPFDLLAKRGEFKLYIEVKGTTGDGAAVMVTAGEVHHAQGHPDNSVLFVVRNVDLDRTSEQPRVTGGDIHIEFPWTPRDDRLRATQFYYRCE